jgi:hypothetical protein
MSIAHVLQQIKPTVAPPGIAGSEFELKFDVPFEHGDVIQATGGQLVYCRRPVKDGWNVCVMLAADAEVCLTKAEYQIGAEYKKIAPIY